MIRNLAIPSAAVAIALLTGCSNSSSISTLRPPTLPEMSTEDLEAQAALDLERARWDYLHDFPDVELPQVDRVRFISLSDWPDVMAECMQDAGFDAYSPGDGGISWGAPMGQELPFGIAQYTCSVKYPVDPRANVELNEDQIRYLYDYYTLVATPCLEALGYTDLPEPPSQQSYISTYQAGPSWDIYSTVSDQAVGDGWIEAIDKCPQIPDGLYG